jgi:hypothetical protein
VTAISFSDDYDLNDVAIRLTYGTVGIYFIFLDQLRVQYPFGLSRLIYIGLSESKQNSIGRRLYGHLTGQSGNFGIRNYAARHRVRFTFHSFQLLRHLGPTDLYETESFFLSSFLEAEGSFPICNNQSGVMFSQSSMTLPDVSVDWDHFA